MIETLKAWGLVRARSACDEGRLVATAVIGPVKLAWAHVVVERGCGA
jgi:hypothetical protein